MRAIGHTSFFLNAVSNRLAAASTRARFLGMVIGTAISQLIEPPGKGMKFDLEEMDSSEAMWYLNLVKINDRIGSLGSLKVPKNTANLPKHTATKGPNATSASRPQGRTNDGSAKIVAIEEIHDSDAEDEEEDEDDDLVPYEKPDEDPVDEEDDPTLIQRNKPTAPV